MNCRYTHPPVRLGIRCFAKPQQRFNGLFGTHPLDCYLRYHGGIQPRHRIRSTRSLSLGEREEISRGVVTGQSVRSIASFLGRSASTVCREIKKNGGRIRYRAADADKAAWQRSKRPKPCLLAKNIRLKGLVTRKLSENWSPEPFQSKSRK